MYKLDGPIGFWSAMLLGVGIFALLGKAAAIFIITGFQIRHAPLVVLYIAVFPGASFLAELLLFRSSRRRVLARSPK